ncbi:phosphoprotein phosphatase, putative [Bodo saltans]|uniref:Serine/threonine-protein phosphatase n=1 Tax=Bodo saltans TaxID=75058 RepID=A0A0S4IS15_BODSA|nr:phosphoprotein phosphatase, putative [Bodo saltans]|eukprot:CUE91716.1 phosphoprotein phosphatase, putative [Bodo saltans]
MLNDERLSADEAPTAHSVGPSSSSNNSSTTTAASAKDENEEHISSAAAPAVTTSAATDGTSNEADGGDDEGGDMDGGAQNPMYRVDSMFSPQILDTTNDASFPVVQDDVVHQPPADMKTLFSAPPRKGAYMTLIQDLLRPVAAAAVKADGTAASSPTSHGGSASSSSAASNYLTRDIAMDVCRDVTAVLTDEPSLLDVKIQEGETLVVVGDVHGQFHDMAHHVLNQQYEKPAGSKDRKFLFLGDYVDRGPQGVETILLLFALKIEYPDQIYLIRGNHEESQTSRIYGFLFEVRTKFNDLSVWARFNEVFCYIPLAAIVSAPGHRFFAVHGGLSPGLTDVDSIRSISRTDYGGMLDNTESDIVDGLLWSDPSDAVVRFSRNERGCGYLFGAAAATEFCEQNNLDFICRAHQMTMQGYTWAHNKKVLTVFSAPNYCGVSNNLASILLVTHEWELNFVQFAMAPNRQPIAPPASAFSSWSNYFQS